MGNKQQQQPQVVIVKHEHGCLVPLLALLAFGWVSVPVMVAWKLTKAAWRLTLWALREGWRWTVAYPVAWTAAACVWAWRGTLALVQRVRANR